MFSEEGKRRYKELIQKSQAGIKYLAEMFDNKKLYEPKHLRVGINTAIVEHSALSMLLVEKGIITAQELEDCYIRAHEEEVKRMEAELNQRSGGLPFKLDVPPGFGDR